MKLFKSLLVAPATLGLLAPMSATANEVTINDFNPAEEIAVTNSRVDGLEARLNNFEAGGFSDTTSASFSAEAILGGVSSDLGLPEAVSLDYQYQIGLSSSFTGEDSLDVTIDVGNQSGSVTSFLMGMDTTDDVLTVDGITYSFPVGGATVIVGDTTDISASYTGACAYGGFVDYITDCGTGNSIGVGGADEGVAVSASYAFDGGFSIAGGVSSPANELVGEFGTDVFGIEAAYSADDYGVAAAFSDVETVTFVGLNGFYAFDFATVSAGYESAEVEGVDDDFSAFFVGMTKEVGPGTFELGYASSNMDPTGFGIQDTIYLYEASYSYPVNDALSITPGVAIMDTEEGVLTLAAVKASFSF